jgi:tetratricopeptide (TPR) repeat protein
LANAGKLTEAKPVAQAALDGLRRKLGPEHPEVLKAMHQLVFCVRELGSLEEAEPILRELLEIQQKAAGPHALETEAARDDLAECLALEGKHGEAAALFADLIRTAMRNTASFPWCRYSRALWRTGSRLPRARL